jgi:hypothetical protein
MAAPSQERKFGSLLHEKRLPRANAIVVGLVGLAFLWVALAAGPITLNTIPVLLLALGLLAMVAWTLTYRARIYDQGVTTESLFGRRELMFRDLHTFSYSRIVRAGQETASLSFVPRVGKPVRVAVQSGRGQDVDLAGIVDALSAKGAARMEQELARTRRVRWVTHVPRTMPSQPGVSLTRDAFLLEEGGPSVTTIPFAKVETVMSNGLFIVSDLGTNKRRFAIPCFAPNFYPGLALQLRLREAMPAASPGSVMSSA